jgi:hypothetical protein
MKKRFFLGAAVLVFLAGFAVMSFAAPQLQPPGQKYKLTLVNGTIMEGEIVAVTEKTISIRDASLGVIAIARENIVKIEPPLDQATGAAATPPPPPPVTPRYADQPYAPANNGIKLGFSLSGGLGMINGGDFNAYIRDWNAYCADYNDYYNGDYYTIDWKEMKSMTNFGGEVFARFGKNFGVGLGVEYIKKSNPGNIAWDDEGSETDTYWWGYVNYSYYEHDTYVYDQTLTVIPITLNLYYYIPLDHTGEVYFKVGPGYYLGTLKSTLDYSGSWGYYDEYHWSDGDLWPPHWKSDTVESENSNADATCNTIGFHFGAGFNFNLGNNIALFGEALYRLANFKEWKGSAGYDYNYQRDYGWYNNGWVDHVTITASDDDTWDGDLWHYIWHSSSFDADYTEIGLWEDKPDDTSSRSEIRPAEININGFAFKVGIKFFFDLGGRR